MSTSKSVYDLYERAKRMYYDDSSRIVIMSDCHRGDGSGSDNFSQNQNIYIVALNHYYRKNFTYIELGDGDELWENKEIINGQKRICIFVLTNWAGRARKASALLAHAAGAGRAVRAPALLAYASQTPKLACCFRKPRYPRVLF